MKEISFEMEMSTQALWKELHTRALSVESGKDDSSWLRSWAKKIPRFTKGCNCNEHWGKWVRANPPVFKNTDTYFAWTVEAHNAVNTRLNKPLVTVEQAKLLYR